MNKIGKYEFNSSVQADDMIAALGTTTTELGDVVPSHNHCVVRLGYIVLEQGEYDEEGEEIKAPVLSEKYHLDVAWKLTDTYDEDGELISATHPEGWEDNG